MTGLRYLYRLLKGACISYCCRYSIMTVMYNWPSFGLQNSLSEIALYCTFVSLARLQREQKQKDGEEDGIRTHAISHCGINHEFK